MSNLKFAPWYARRRTRSVGSVPFTWQTRRVCVNSTLSDEICSSSTSKERDCSNFYQSDSDDICGGIRHNMSYDLPNAPTTMVVNSMESDSFNENSPCRRSTRRKRKYKKMTMEVDQPVNRFFHPSTSFLFNKKKRLMRISSNFQAERFWLCSGKRKRSLREKSRLSIEGGSESSSVGKDAKVLGISKLSLNDYPEVHYDSMEVSCAIANVSSSSVSSSGSETGVFTNDEGREGDDEQSDWVGDVGLAPGALPTRLEDEVEESEDNTSALNCRGKAAVIYACQEEPSLINANKLFLSSKDHNCVNRLTRRKIRSLKMPLPVEVLKSNTTEFHSRNSNFGYVIHAESTSRENGH